MDEVPGLGVDIDEELRGASIRTSGPICRSRGCATGQCGTGRPRDRDTERIDTIMLSVVVEQPNRWPSRTAAARARCRRSARAGPLRRHLRLDLHIFHGKNPFVAYPRIIGHEFVGRIDAVGEGVDRRASASSSRSIR